MPDWAVQTLWSRRLSLTIVPLAGRFTVLASAFAIESLPHLFV